MPEGGRDCLDGGGNKEQAYLKPALGKATRETLTAGPVSDFWRFDITAAPGNSWDVQLAVPVTGDIAKGDRCLLIFYCRAVEGRDADGLAYGMASVEDRSAGFHKIGQTDFKAGTKWEPVLLPFEADAALTQGQGSVSIHLGREIQCLDIGGVRLFNYGADYDLARLPHPALSYDGREPDAPWRAAALQRISATREGPLNLEVVDAQGKPVSGAGIHAVLKRHAFGFGSAVTAQWLCAEGADGDKYRKIVDECFSRVVFENDLKLFAWDLYKSPEQSGSFRKAWLEQSLAWLGGRHFTVRGHYLCWAPFEPWSEKLRATPEVIREKVFEHMDGMLPEIGSRVTEWDAVNHPAGWEPGICLDSVLGAGFYTEVFQRARKQSSLPLWINEDQVFRPGRQQEEYYRIIQKLLADGVKIDGIGNQAHFHASFLPSPTEILKTSDRFAALVPALQLTEYDVSTNGDEALAADYTRDMLITCFSHPAYTGVVMWGFWEGSHWKPGTALWRQDWSEKPAARIWREWVCGKWRTDVMLKTSALGTAASRGFYGLYEITVTRDGTTTSHEVRHEKGAERVVVRLK